jgi:L-amino acid N-acyltransferase YncA
VKGNSIETPYGSVGLSVADAWGQSPGCGLGGVLGKEIFAIASDLGIEKIVAQMTVDQRQASALVERHGFKHEAVLHDFVNDLVVMTCDVARLESGAH